MAGPRRSFLKAAGAAAALPLARPALAQGAAARNTLRFIPHANLGAVDPVATSGYIVRNYGFMVYDTLYGVDTEFRTRPQMIEGHEVSNNGLLWQFRLREGLRFHDNEPVRGVDCVASIRRWGARDTMGQTLMTATDEIRATSDRSFEIRLKRPFPLMLDSLGKLSTQALFIVPERVGNSDPQVPNNETIGSGPFRFVRNQWVPGSLAVFEKFASYVPRNEPNSGAAGGKNVLLDRVEWRIIPDASTSASALQTGEVDWYEQPSFDLLPTMQRSRDIRIEITDPLGSLMMIRFNQLHPPFDKPAIRRALLMAVDQSAYLDAVVGNLPQYKALCRSMYACNTPLGRDQGASVMPGNLERARQALREAGYANEKVIILGATDNPANNAMAQVTTDLLRRLGMNVELVATDWSALLARRANRNAPERGGWSIFHTSWVGVDVAGPALHLPLRTHGAPAWAGWPDDPQIEALRNQFLEAPNPQEAERIAMLLQARAFESVPFVPLGQFIQPTAFRRNVQGIVNAPVPYFWGVSKG
ncbi:MAG: ABC transporter substrate-binding protein [Roseococcus sp.]